MVSHTVPAESCSWFSYPPPCHRAVRVCVRAASPLQVQLHTCRADTSAPILSLARSTFVDIVLLLPPEFAGHGWKLAISNAGKTPVDVQYGSAFRAGV